MTNKLTPPLEAKGSDNPLNIIKFNNKKIVIQSERITYNLLKTNNLK
ncbi:hypothetical protein ACGK9U_02030 [Mariniflexile sp. HNIBRBA6329]